MQRYADTPLDVMVSGHLPPNPSELLQSHAMEALLLDLRTRYDVVILDAPPLLPVTDAALLATRADGAVVVVSHGRTTRDQLSTAIERLDSVGANTLGVVVNLTPAKQSGSGYGYGYGYAPSRTARPTRTRASAAGADPAVPQPRPSNARHKTVIDVRCAGGCARCRAPRARPGR